MRRKKKRRYSLEVIVPSLIIVPPLGFFLLWLRARTRKGKIAVIVAFVIFSALATGAFFKIGVYARLKGPAIPESGFDITHDSRGRYETPKVLPFEWMIFSEVVREMRRLQPEYTIPDADTTSMEMIQPEYLAFEKVAGEHDMYPGDVKGIYLKVTSVLMKGGKKK